MEPREYVSNTCQYTYGKLITIHTGEEATLTHGSFCSFASKIRVYLGGHHRTDYITTYPFGTILPEIWGGETYGHPANKGDVHIGSDVWIGDDVAIMPNVRIGHGAVIGCKAVVTKDVKPYAVVAGNPARFIRYRFSKEIIDQLLEIRWWDLPIDTIKQLVPFLMNSDVEYNIPRITEIISLEESRSREASK